MPLVMFGGGDGLKGADGSQRESMRLSLAMCCCLALHCLLDPIALHK